MGAKNRTLEILIAAKDKTRKGVKSALAGLSKIKSFGKKAAIGIAVGAAAASAALGLLISKTMDSVDELGKTADKLGVTTEALAAMRHAANLAGLSNKELDTSLQYLERSIGMAAKGTGAQAEAMEALGLSVEDLQKAGPQKAMGMVVDGLNKIEDATLRTKYSMDIFSRSGTAILNLTAGSLRDAEKEAAALGLTMSRTDVRAIEDANDNITRFKAGLKGAAQSLTAALAPAITATFGVLVEKVKTLAEGGAIKKWANSAASAITRVAKAIVTGLPDALLIVLGILGKIAMGIRGWRLLVSEAKIQWYNLAIFMQNTISDTAKIATVLLDKINIGGKFDDNIRGLVGFVRDQATVVNQLNADKNAELKRQAEGIAAMNKEQRAIAEYETKIEGVRTGLAGLTKDLEETVQKQKAVGEGKTDKAVSEVDKLADAYIRLARAQGTFLDRASASRAMASDDLGILAEAAAEAERSQ